MLQLVDREPGLVFDLCEAAGVPAGDPPEEPVPGPSPNMSSWCKYNHRREMPTDLERKRCDCVPQNCLSERLVMITN